MKQWYDRERSQLYTNTDPKGAVRLTPGSAAGSAGPAPAPASAATCGSAAAASAAAEDGTAASPAAMPVTFWSLALLCFSGGVSCAPPICCVVYCKAQPLIPERHA